MLHSVKDLEHYKIGAQDGVIGQVIDLFFDDHAWVIRHLVVKLGEEDEAKTVLISPISMVRKAWSDHIFPVRLTTEQIRNSPDVDTDKPVSRQQEMGYAGYYGFGSYWGGGGLWGAGIYPDILQGGRQHLVDGSTERMVESADPHLRSINNVMRYYVHASDGDIGHVSGFLVDEETWAIRYIIVNTSNWWIGHQVILAPQWISDLSWTESTVSFDVTRDAVRHAPGYDGGATLDADGEGRLAAHYGLHSHRSASATASVSRAG
jgi:hypothetical protein